MIGIYQENQFLLCCYSCEGSPWVSKKLIENEGISLCRGIFSFKKNDLVDKNDIDKLRIEEKANEGIEEITFVLGKQEGDYYRINARILGTKHHVYLLKSMSIRCSTFMAHDKISIFRRIDKLVTCPIKIGEIGEIGDNIIPTEVFEKLLKKFPTSTEVQYYVGSRIELIIQDYLEIDTNTATQRLNKHLNKKSLLNLTNEKESIGRIYQFEAKKYEYIRNQINKMFELPCTEKDWQNLISQFILLIFPKYIAVLEEVPVKDFFSKKEKSTYRKIDLALVDVKGNLDIVEIKKPDVPIISDGLYRENHTPRRELSGAIMQIEKYIFHLNKWGATGEKHITKKYSNELPKKISIKIINPKALIILGRSSNFNEKQNFDLELIRRKYANMLDIITYDDLLNRLDNIIEKFSGF